MTPTHEPRFKAMQSAYLCGHEKLLLLLFFTGLLATGLGCRSCQEQYNNQTIKRAIKSEWTPDLRTLFESPPIIESLEQNGQCLFDYMGKVSRIKLRHHPQLLSDLVLQFRGAPYDGQIKVISKDSFIQTPWVPYDPDSQTKIFVNPGDLVHVQTRD